MSAENDFVREEARNIGIVLKHIQELLAKPQWNAYELAAMGTFLHNAYSGVERILRCRLTEGGKLPKADESWHRNLLRRALETSFLTEIQHSVLFDLLQFRHFYVHGYAHLLDEARLRRIAESALPVIGEFLSGASPL
jgi:hypothetical protein